MDIFNLAISASKLNGFSNGVLVLITAVFSVSFELSGIFSCLSALWEVITCGFSTSREFFGMCWHYVSGIAICYRCCT